MEIDASDPEQTVREGRAKMLELAEKMNLPPEARALLMEKADKIAQEFLRDGPRVTSAKSITSMMKEVSSNLSEVAEGFIGLAKGTGEATSYAMGMIAADVESARALLDTSRGRLRDMLDSGVFDLKPKKKDEAESAPPAAASPLS
jgi:fructose-1-phosphate kinase PfkB-like protein